MANPQKKTVLEFRAKLTANGRIVLPAECRKAMNLAPDEEIIIRVSDQEATLYSVHHAVKLAQSAVQKHMKGKKNLVEQLMDARREEASNE